MRHTHDGQDTTGRLESLVRDRLAERIGEDLARSVGREEKFHDLGIDSLDIVTVLAALERECAVDRIADGELWDIADTVDALVRYLSEHGRTSAERP
ncbi:acyl carrier protein [Streptomyces sp. NPDC088147]|uniref:acyl carrier protein n=1 Tax=unclassified Streptomyces TaxID=2593676 RepID=UPI0033A81ED2